MDCYHSDVNCCVVMVVSTATMLWRRSLLIPSNGSDKCFPCRCESDVVASCPLVKSGVAYSSVVGTGLSTVVLLRQQQQLISGFDWEVNCCPVATTSTDFRLWLGCQLLSCCDNDSNWFPVMTGMSTAVLLWQQQQLISGYNWDVNCCPVVTTTATDFQL
jgi:hypothetical protein